MGSPGEPRPNEENTTSPPVAASINWNPNLLPSTYWESAIVLSDDAHGEGPDDNASSTKSLTDSILTYRTINGRTYHSERGNASYWAANDDRNCDSQDIMHHALTLCNDGKLYKAPLERGKLKTCLDIGTGTGTWAIDFADEFPECLVIATDISPIQPNIVPDNLHFVIEDCTDEWTINSDSQDYVHIRWLYGSIADWDHIFKEAFRVCRPGGWCESIEAGVHVESDDGTVPKTSAMAEWGRYYVEGGKILGRTFEVIERDIQPIGMAAAGFQDLRVFDMKVPVGTWPKDPRLREIGRHVKASVDADYEGYISLIAHLTQGWTETEVSVYCAHLRREMMGTADKVHGFFRLRHVCGRKPERTSP